MSRGTKAVRVGRFERLAAEMEAEAKRYEEVAGKYTGKNQGHFEGKAEAYREAARLLHDAVEGE